MATTSNSGKKRRSHARPKRPKRKLAHRKSVVGRKPRRGRGGLARRRGRGGRSRRYRGPDRTRSGRYRGRDRSRSRRGRARCMSSDFNIPLNVPRNLQEIKFETYIKRVLKKVKPRVGIKKQSLKMMDNLMKDTLHQIATHAASKMGRRKTLKPRLILRAMKKVMPKSLADKVDEHAQNALEKYDRHYRCPRRRR